MFASKTVLAALGIALVFVWSGSLALADPSAELTSFIEESLQLGAEIGEQTACEAGVGEGASLASSPEDHSGFTDHGVAMRFRGRAGLQLPFFAKLRFIPEVELFWGPESE